MKTIEFLLHLNNVQLVKPEQWKACCPGHRDRHPSLIITEVDDRLLIHCRAGCRTSDVLAAIGLDFSDLFFDSRKTNETTWNTGSRQQDGVPQWNWNWRRQCAELEQAIQAKREDNEAILQSAHGLDINSLTADEFDELWRYVGGAYAWLERCEQLDETVFLLQQTLRHEEWILREDGRKMKVAA